LEEGHEAGRRGIDVPDELVRPFPVFGKGHKTMITGTTNIEAAAIMSEKRLSP
jgi:hypothetical protein